MPSPLSISASRAIRTSSRRGQRAHRCQEPEPNRRPSGHPADGCPCAAGGHRDQTGCRDEPFVPSGLPDDVVGLRASDPCGASVAPGSKSGVSTSTARVTTISLDSSFGRGSSTLERNAVRSGSGSVWPLFRNTATHRYRDSTGTARSARCPHATGCTAASTRTRTAETSMRTSDARHHQQPRPRKVLLPSTAGASMSGPMGSWVGLLTATSSKARSRPGVRLFASAATRRVRVWLERSRFGGFSGRVVVVGSGGPRLGVGNRGCVLMPGQGQKAEAASAAAADGLVVPEYAAGGGLGLVASLEGWVVVCVGSRGTAVQSAAWSCSNRDVVAMAHRQITRRTLLVGVSAAALAGASGPHLLSRHRARLPANQSARSSSVTIDTSWPG